MSFVFVLISSNNKKPRVHHLEFILVVDLLFAGPEILGQVEGVGHVLRRHKVIDYLNTAVEVLDLRDRTERRM